MSQDSILKLLKKYPKGLSSKEIAEKLKLNKSSIAKSISSLRNQGEVSCEWRRRDSYDVPFYIKRNDIRWNE